MKLEFVPSSFIVFPNLGPWDMGIYIPDVSQEEAVALRQRAQNYKCQWYWGSRHNDYIWASRVLGQHSKPGQSLADVGGGTSIWPLMATKDLQLKVSIYESSVTNHFGRDIGTWAKASGLTCYWDVSEVSSDHISCISVLEHSPLDCIPQMTVSSGGLILVTADIWVRDSRHEAIRLETLEEIFHTKIPIVVPEQTSDYPPIAMFALQNME